MSKISNSITLGITFAQKLFGVSLRRPERKLFFAGLIAGMHHVLVYLCEEIQLGHFKGSNMDLIQVTLTPMGRGAEK